MRVRVVWLRGRELEGVTDWLAFKLRACCSTISPFDVAINLSLSVDSGDCDA